MKTPAYIYNLNLLHHTIDRLLQASSRYGYKLHYAVKANANPRILSEISARGIGADCVSGNEIEAAIANGFSASDIVFAGVGKTDEEITLALAIGIKAIHCESIDELTAINSIAQSVGRKASVALRINPNIDADTHWGITTGTEQNKFGIGITEAKKAIAIARNMEHISIIGLHFHIGSQIRRMEIFATLAQKAIALYRMLFPNVKSGYINLGGGLGIDYQSPERNPIPDFGGYFEAINRELGAAPGIEIHFELGRSIVGQCGRLATKVLYTKKNRTNRFVIVDAGMNTLLRPALYGAHHKIINTSSKSENLQRYTIVGPICESTDILSTDALLPETHRGDILEVLSCGAYGESMSSSYNLRDLPVCYFENDTPAIPEPVQFIHQ